MISASQIYGGIYGRSKITTAPASEPVTTDEAKAHLRIDFSDDDTLIDALIVAARNHCEHYTKRRFITQTATQYLDQWPHHLARGGGVLSGGRRVGPGWVELLESPAASITSVTTYDEESNATVWSSGEYRLSDSGSRGRLVPTNSATWPTATRDSDAIEIVYVCGYGAADAVPQAIKQAMLMLIGHWYENRESVVLGANSFEVPQGVRALLQPFRVMDL